MTLRFLSTGSCTKSFMEAKHSEFKSNKRSTPWKDQSLLFLKTAIAIVFRSFSQDFKISKDFTISQDFTIALKNA